MKRTRTLVSVVVVIVFMVTLMLPMAGIAEETRISGLVSAKEFKNIREVYQAKQLVPDLEYKVDRLSQESELDWERLVVTYKLVGRGHIQIPFYTDGRYIPEGSWRSTKVEAGQYMLVGYLTDQFTSDPAKTGYILSATLYRIEWDIPDPATPILSTRPLGPYGPLQGPEEACEGDVLIIRFNSPDGGSMEGSISVSGLDFQGITSNNMGSSLSTEDHVFSLFGDPVDYLYTVRAVAGEQVSATFSDAQQSDADGILSELPVLTWSKIVLPRDPSMPPAPTPTLSTSGREPFPTPSPQATVKPSSTPVPTQKPKLKLKSSSKLRLTDTYIGCVEGLTLNGAPHTRAELLAQFERPSAGTLRIVDKDANDISNLNTRPATGDLVYIARDDPQYAYDLVYVIVEGDVLGTGKLDIRQLVRLTKAVSGEQPLGPPYCYAVANGGRPTVADLVKLANLLK